MNEKDFERLAHERRSVRGFLKDTVPLPIIQRILTTARTAPSGANLQPGKFVALTGAPLGLFSDRLCQAIDDGLEATEQYSYFPDPMPRYLKQRQVKTGAALYDTLGIDRKDMAARHQQFLLNYRFFHAPVGIVATIDRRMGKGCFMDFGMALNSLFLATRSHGLACCGIGALAHYGPYVSKLLALDETEMVVCGVALGYQDDTATVNKLHTDRLPLDQYARFEGW